MTPGEVIAALAVVCTYLGAVHWIVSTYREEMEEQ